MWGCWHEMLASWHVNSHCRSHSFPPEFPSKVESPIRVHYHAPDWRESRVASSTEFVYVVAEWRCQNSLRIQGWDVKILLIGDVKILHSSRTYRISADLLTSAPLNNHPCIPSDMENGGSTRIWTTENLPSPAVDSVSCCFRPVSIARKKIAQDAEAVLRLDDSLGSPRWLLFLFDRPRTRQHWLLMKNTCTRIWKIPPKKTHCYIDQWDCCALANLAGLRAGTAVSN